LIAAIDNTDEPHRDILRLVLSSIIVRVSNQDSDTRYAAVPKNLPSGVVFASFRTAAKRIVNALDQRSTTQTSALVLNRNTLKVSPDEIPAPVGAVITSPPYPNAYEYWLYHKYRMYWLGYDPIAVRKDEIGARAHFFGGEKHTADDFGHQMRDTLRLVDGVLMPGGYAAFVVGRSRIHGEIIDNAATIEGLAAEYGFQVGFRAERTIYANRKSFNLAHANIKTETILILTR